MVNGSGLPTFVENDRKDETVADASRYLVISEAGVNRDLSKGSRDQLYWDEHGTFIDELVETRFVLLGGPFPDDGGALLIVQADSAEDVRTRVIGDPWYRHGLLSLVSITRWDVFIDQWPARS